MSIDQHTEIDEGKLMQFVFRAVGEVGATLNAALVVMGDKLGLYQALAEGILVIVAVAVDQWIRKVRR